MQINLATIDAENFNIKSGEFCGISAILVVPNHIGTKFTQSNKIFRSSIWDTDGNLLSASFPKFVNWGENPENFPPPNSLQNCNIISKVDGSLVAIDFTNGEVSMRTRGVFSYKTAENFKDFEYCLQKYPKFVNNIDSNITYIFEITTPNNKIVINYGDEPEFTFIGAINKQNYSLIVQSELDNIAKLYGFKRPIKYQFGSILELINNIQNSKGIEGVVVYSNNDQEMHKCKSLEYLAKHRAIEELGNPEKVLDLWLIIGKPDYNTFTDYIITNFDYEMYSSIRGEMSKIIDANKNAVRILDHAKKFVDKIKTYSTRKQQALEIMTSYGGAINKSDILFGMLDGKEINDNQYKRLITQNL